ncbi:MAG: ATP synthase F1 subunit delta [Myxococcota bacterium]
MANEQSIARRYALAMVDVAAEAGSVDVVAEQLVSFETVLQAHDGLLGTTLQSPVFTVEERRAVLDEVLPKLGLHALTQNLLRLLNDNGRLGILGAISETYRDLADERAGRVRVVVQSAEPLTEALESEVRQALEATTGKTVVIEAEVDPSLIGGLVARVGSTVYDSSLRTRLQNIKGALLAGASPAQA